MAGWFLVSPSMPLMLIRAELTATALEIRRSPWMATRAVAPHSTTVKTKTKSGSGGGHRAARPSGDQVVSTKNAASSPTCRKLAKACRQAPSI